MCAELDAASPTWPDDCAKLMEKVKLQKQRADQRKQAEADAKQQKLIEVRSAAPLPDLR